MDAAVDTNVTVGFPMSEITCGIVSVTKSFAISVCVLVSCVRIDVAALVGEIALDV